MGGSVFFFSALWISFFLRWFGYSFVLPARSGKIKITRSRRSPYAHPLLQHMKKVCAEWTVPETSKPGKPDTIRIDHFLSHVAADQFPSATSAKNAIRKGLILRNSAKVRGTSDSVSVGDVISYMITTETEYVNLKTPSAHSSVMLNKYVLIAYEDDSFAVLVKPQGITFDQLNSQAMLLLSPPSPTPTSNSSREVEEVQEVLRRPHAAHRLDVDTGGLICVAKTKLALQRLSDMFGQREISKEYIALVIGKQSFSCANANSNSNSNSAHADTRDSSHDGIDDIDHIKTTGIIDFDLDGKSAITHWEQLRSDTVDSVVTLGGNTGTVGADRTKRVVSTLLLMPSTGRNHQLRRHLKQSGFPIIGDSKYGPTPVSTPESVSESVSEVPTGNKPIAFKYKYKYLALWSTRLVFEHPCRPGTQVDVRLPEECLATGEDGEDGEGGEGGMGGEGEPSYIAALRSSILLS